MRLLHNRVLVKPISNEKIGSVLLLASDQKKECRAKVVLVGEKCDTIHEGQVVVHHEHVGTPLKYRGDDLLILDVCDEKQKGDVIAVL